MSNKLHLLIVEDERSTREGLLRLLRGEYDVTLAEDGMRGINLIRRHEYDVVLTDLRMPGADGMDVLRAALEREQPPACIVITAYGSIESAVAAMRAGACDFITKPVNLDQLEVVIRRAVEARLLKQENLELKRRLDQKFGLAAIVGESAAMHEVFETVKQVAPTRTTILLSGESGTGKELIAQAIHQLSGRTGPFVPVHCAALPETLLESELFGHEKGAFTGAAERRLGRFEMADGGTLMLDEIGEISTAIQVKLLRVLETRAFERVGGNTTIQTDSRIVAATNRDLKAMVERGEFREDLYYRLVVVNLHLPPLRERPEDVPLLIRRFIDEFARENQRDIAGLAADALDLLCAYDWPGNVRELRNAIERMVVLSRDRELQIRSVPPNIREKVAPGSVRRHSGRTASLDLETNERLLLERALEQTDGNRTRAARALGISRRTLQRKMHLYQLGCMVALLATLWVSCRHAEPSSPTTLHECTYHPKNHRYGDDDRAKNDIDENNRLEVIDHLVLVNLTTRRMFCYPLMCADDGDYPNGAEMIFYHKDDEDDAKEPVHAVFPQGMEIPGRSKGEVTLVGHFQGIKKRDRFASKKPPMAKIKRFRP